jgi:hypothetical protein
MGGPPAFVKRRSKVESSALSKAALKMSGTGGTTRTCNLTGNSRSLYQLTLHRCDGLEPAGKGRSKMWCAWRDSNSQPSASKADALSN